LEIASLLIIIEFKVTLKYLEGKKMASEFKYVNPFVVSAIDVIKKTTDVSVKKKDIYSRDGKVSIGGVGIILSLTGDIDGTIVYEFSRGVTMRLASKMIEKSMITFEDPSKFKKLLESAIMELANIISGNAITILSKMGFSCMITPPEIFLGKGVILIPKRFSTIVIELSTIFGDFMIDLSITRVRNKKVQIYVNN
jgi:chemotaxis protein CheX